MLKFYRNTFLPQNFEIYSIMLRNLEKEGLFQNYFGIFNFGHFFLSIFENQGYFYFESCDRYFLPNLVF